MTVKFEFVDSWHGFHKLKPFWDKLLQQSDADTIFLSWHWIDSWHATLPNPITPYIVVLKKDDKIVGIAPLYRQKYKLVKLFSFDVLCMLADKNVGSEYPNFIVESNHADYYRQLLWQYLQAQNNWDLIWITNIATWRPSGKSLCESINNTSLSYHDRQISFASTALSQFDTAFDTRQSVLNSLSKSLRKNIKQTERKLAKQGDVKHLTVTDPADIKTHLNTLFSLHDMRWREAGLSGSFARRKQLKDFYSKFVPIALSQNQLSLQLLCIDNTPYAVQLGYIYGNQFLAIQEGFNPNLIAGSGQVLRFYSLLQCLEANLSSYDFLGVYTDHKRRWLASENYGKQLLIWHSKKKNIFLNYHPIWPTGKYLTQDVGS